MRIKMRGSLSHKIRKINESLRSDRQLLRLQVKLRIALLRRKIVSEPLHREAGCLCDSHRMIFPRNRAAERMNASQRIKSRRLCVRKYDAARSDCSKRLPVADHARSYGRSRVISGSCRKDGTLFQPCAPRGFLANPARSLRAFFRRNKKRGIDLQFRAELFAPAPLPDIKQLRSAGVRNIRKIFSAEFEAYIILRK